MAALAQNQDRLVQRYKGVVIFVVDVVLIGIVAISVFAGGNYLASFLFDQSGEVAAQAQLDQANESYQRGLRAPDAKSRFESFREAIALARRIQENYPQSEIASKLWRDGRFGKFDLDALRNFVALETPPPRVHVVIGRRTGIFRDVGDWAAGGAFLHWIEYGMSNWWPESSLQLVGGYLRGFLMAVFIFSIYWVRRLQQDDASMYITNAILGLWGLLAALAALDDLLFRLEQFQSQIWTDLGILISRDNGSAMWFPTFLPFFQNAWLPYWLIGIVLTLECFALMVHREGVVFHFLRVHLSHRLEQFRKRIGNVGGQGSADVHGDGNGNGNGNGNGDDDDDNGRT